MLTYAEFCKLAKRAVNIAQTLGVRQAAGYLRNREMNINASLIVLGFKVREPGLTYEAPLPRGVLESDLVRLSLVPKV